MQLKDRKQVAGILQEAADQRWKWVAFDARKDGSPLHGFVSAAEAQDFCTAANNQFDYGEQEFIAAGYNFLPVANLAAGFEPNLVKGAPDPVDAASQLAAMNVRLQPGWRMDDVKPYLQQGLFFPVQWQRVIDPEKEVKRFLVIEHTHPGHQIYEIGHEVGILRYFDKQEEGLEFLRGKAKEYSDTKRPADLILAGEYRGRFLKLEQDGTPEQHCGITLMNIHCGKDGQLHTYASTSLNQPVTIEETLYAQYDQKRQTIRLHDDQLKWTAPSLLSASTYPSYFIKETLTIKHLGLMNQESFEYNKNQLISLGFGQEISEQLMTKMDQNLTEFTLNHTRRFGKDEVQSVLHFSKGDDLEKDLTFFNRFDSTLKKEGLEDLTQTFYVGKAYNYTLQERYNMMDGRAVYREQPVLRPVEANGTTKMKPTGDTYFGWKALDFKAADKWGNFMPKTLFWKHQQEVEKFPIKNIEDNYERSRIMAKLQKGNYVDVTLVRDGREQQAKMVANPKMVRFDFYDEQGQSLVVRKAEKKALDETQKVEMTPQEVQRAAIAKAAEQAQTNGQAPANGQAQGAEQTQPAAQSQTNDGAQAKGTEQNAAAKQAAENKEEQKQSQGQRRRAGTHL